MTIQRSPGERRGAKRVFVPPGIIRRRLAPEIARPPFAASSSSAAPPSVTPPPSAAPSASSVATTSSVASPSSVAPPDMDERESPEVEMDSANGEREGKSQSGGSNIQRKKGRGRNICKPVANLRNGAKLQVEFYNNRAVGSSVFSRHLGKIVRDRNICPLRVHAWKDIEQERKNHMWAEVTDKFDNEYMEQYREHVLQHMHELWNKWRGDMYRHHVRGKTLQEALRNVPIGVDEQDWHWLVNKHYMSNDYQKASQRNSRNRDKLKMPHRTGSKPFRDIMWEKGGKDGNPPDLAKFFFETRKKGERLVEPETINRHDEILQASQSEPSISNIELVERCFGAQRHHHVVGFGGGITPRDVRGGHSSRVELESQLREHRKQNHSLKSRVDELESQMKQLKDVVQHLQSNTGPPLPPLTNNDDQDY